MTHLVAQFRVEYLKKGVRLIAMGKTPRGTPFIVGDVLIPTNASTGKVPAGAVEQALALAAGTTVIVE